MVAGSGALIGPVLLTETSAGMLLINSDSSSITSNYRVHATPVRCIKEPLADGSSCGADADCQSKVCSNGVCSSCSASTECGTNCGFNGLEYGTMAVNGQCWLDRNLGATQAATSSTDSASYGWLYQWGRGTDGHQIRTSGTTSTRATSDTPGHANYITTNAVPNDWRNPQNNNLWQGVSGINNPCPSGFRLPTVAEWSNLEITDAATALSILKIPFAGDRSNNGTTFRAVDTWANYWTSSVNGTYSSTFLVAPGFLVGANSSERAYGLSVRCIKN
jgi:uncharacterized protein (TIGR02145 family)